MTRPRAVANAMDGKGFSAITVRTLFRDEIARVWTIDRSETIENVYRLQNGSLALRPERHDVRGWPPGEAAKYAPILLDCFDRGGWFYGAFDDVRLVGVVVLDNKYIGERKDQLQVKFLYVSRQYRNGGVGARLFNLAKAIARERGATGLYISATPSENTVRFYMRSGCKVAAEPNPEMFALEPEDIHLECKV